MVDLFPKYRVRTLLVAMLAAAVGTHQLGPTARDFFRAPTSCLVPVDRKGEECWNPLHWAAYHLEGKPRCMFWLVEFIESAPFPDWGDERIVFPEKFQCGGGIIGPRPYGGLEQETD